MISTDLTKGWTRNGEDLRRERGKNTPSISSNPETVEFLTKFLKDRIKESDKARAERAEWISSWREACRSTGSHRLDYPGPIVSDTMDTLNARAQREWREYSKSERKQVLARKELKKAVQKAAKSGLLKLLEEESKREAEVGGPVNDG